MEMPQIPQRAKQLCKAFKSEKKNFWLWHLVVHFVSKTIQKVSMRARESTKGWDKLWFTTAKVPNIAYLIGLPRSTHQTMTYIQLSTDLPTDLSISATSRPDVRPGDPDAFWALAIGRGEQRWKPSWWLVLARNGQQWFMNVNDRW